PRGARTPSRPSAGEVDGAPGDDGRARHAGGHDRLRAVPLMRRLRLLLAYDGTDFAGWQIQPELRTVQGVLTAALTRLNGDRPVSVRGAGRTDAGVHALGQVADCGFAGELPDAGVAHALSRMLPDDLRVLAVATVADGFHA